MRRTAAFLLLPLFLVSPLILRQWLPDPFRLDWFGLLPCLLVLAAGIIRPHPAVAGMQAVGSLWLLALWVRLLLRSNDPIFEILRGLPFLGMSLISLAESAVFSRRPPGTGPERRFALALLLLTSALEIFWTAYSFHVGLQTSGPRPIDIPRWLEHLGPSIGLAAVLLLAAWGYCRELRWTMGAGIAATGWTVVSGIWGYARHSLAVVFYFTEAFPSHLLLATAAVMLARRLRRGRQESRPAR